MPRREHGFKREVLPDPMYNSQLVTKLVNNIMYDGKKSTAQRIVYEAFDIVKEKTGNDPLDMFKKALDNIMPALEVKAVRRGGSNYQVPMDVRADRKQTLGLRWLITYARTRSDRKMCERLAAEIIDAVNGTGGAVKKKEDTLKMAEANKAFAHYRW
ncbi:MAG: 30S ribosomal protein S7 [Clostridiales bacterium]|nr:30S ribosomal protein S7 [Candidatus Coliplasma equi]